MENEFEKIEIEKEDFGPEPILDPFSPSDIDIRGRTITLQSLFDRLVQEPKELILHPDFQRNLVWDKTRESRLIESIMLRIPIPAFYFDGTNPQQWTVVDGLQRLNSIWKYKQNKFKLSNLEYLSKIEGMSFDELPREYQRRFNETEIQAFIIEPRTPENVKYNIFKRLNTGGVPLNDTEVRMALHPGKPYETVKSLSALESFKRCVTLPSNLVNRMEDKEFVTRFLAFYTIPYSEYKPPFGHFLNQAMKSLNGLSAEVIDEIRINFNEAMELSLLLFGRHAFRKLSGTDMEQRRNPLNKPLFEVWSVLLAKLGEDERERLVKHRGELINRFVALLKNEKFKKSISESTADKGSINTRFEEISKIIKLTLENAD